MKTQQINWPGNKPRLLVMGYGGHGKGTALQVLNELYGLTGISSSLFANSNIVYPVLKDLYGYTTLEECYNDRHNHRQEWFELIKDYCTPDGTRLARAIYDRYDIYDGVRNIEEFQSIKRARLFHLSIWIDASRRVPIEDISSCTVTPDDAQIVIDNNGDIEYLRMQLKTLIDYCYITDIAV